MRRHGTFSRYTYGCRCAPCTEANRVYLDQYRTREQLRKYARRIYTEDQLRDALTKPEVFWW